MSDTIYREDAIKAIHNYWKKRLDTLPTKESECGEVYADIQQMDKILEHNKALCNFIEAMPSADRLQGKWIRDRYWSRGVGMGEEYGFFYKCSMCEYEVESGYTRCGFNFCPNCGAKMKGADDEYDK